MKVHWLQHVPFEDLAAIEPWLRARGHTLTATRFHAGDRPGPDAARCDWLVVMGGPMNVYQYRDYPWLREERQLIRERIAAGARVLGVCLGAQLIAEVLGARVYQNQEREIGWWPVKTTPESDGTALAFPPGECPVFHWHGDTFDLPPGAIRLAASDACANQAFALGARVLGLQFHLEMRPPEIEAICAACADELTAGRYVQNVSEIRTQSAHAEATGRLLDRLLSRLEQG